MKTSTTINPIIKNSDFIDLDYETESPLMEEEKKTEEVTKDLGIFNFDEKREKEVADTIQGYNEDSSFNEGLHKLILESLGFQYASKKSEEKLTKIDNNTVFGKVFNNTKDPLSEKNLNKILPAIRTQYIREWKRVVKDGGMSAVDKSKSMESIVGKFDDILQKKQDRDQRNSVFNTLFLLFLAETITLFSILIAKGLGKLPGLTDLTLQIVTGATILQVSSMIIFIVLSLFKQAEGIDPSKIIESTISGILKIDTGKESIKKGDESKDLKVGM